MPYFSELANWDGSHSLQRNPPLQAPPPPPHPPILAAQISTSHRRSSLTPLVMPPHSPNTSKTAGAQGAESSSSSSDERELNAVLSMLSSYDSDPKSETASPIFGAVYQKDPPQPDIVLGQQASGRTPDTSASQLPTENEILNLLSIYAHQEEPYADGTETLTNKKFAKFTNMSVASTDMAAILRGSSATAHEDVDMTGTEHLASSSRAGSTLIPNGACTTLAHIHTSSSTVDASTLDTQGMQHVFDTCLEENTEGEDVPELAYPDLTSKSATPEPGQSASFPSSGKASDISNKRVTDDLSHRESSPDLAIEFETEVLGARERSHPPISSIHIPQDEGEPMDEDKPEDPDSISRFGHTDADSRESSLPIPMHVNALEDVRFGPPAGTQLPDWSVGPSHRMKNPSPRDSPLSDLTPSPSKRRRTRSPSPSSTRTPLFLPDSSPPPCLPTRRMSRNRAYILVSPLPATCPREEYVSASKVEVLLHLEEQWKKYKAKHLARKDKRMERERERVRPRGFEVDARPAIRKESTVSREGPGAGQSDRQIQSLASVLNDGWYRGNQPPRQAKARAQARIEMIKTAGAVVLSAPVRTQSVADSSMPPPATSRAGNFPAPASQDAFLDMQPVASNSQTQIQRPPTTTAAPPSRKRRQTPGIPDSASSSAPRKKAKLDSSMPLSSSQLHSSHNPPLHLDAAHIPGQGSMDPLEPYVLENIVPLVQECPEVNPLAMWAALRHIWPDGRWWRERGPREEAVRRAVREEEDRERKRDEEDMKKKRKQEKENAVKGEPVRKGKERKVQKGLEAGQAQGENQSQNRPRPSPRPKDPSRTHAGSALEASNTQQSLSQYANAQELTVQTNREGSSSSFVRTPAITPDITISSSSESSPGAVHGHSHYTPLYIGADFSTGISTDGQEQGYEHQKAYAHDQTPLYDLHPAVSMDPHSLPFLGQSTVQADYAQAPVLPGVPSDEQPLQGADVGEGAIDPWLTSVAGPSQKRYTSETGTEGEADRDLDVDVTIHDLASPGAQYVDSGSAFEQGFNLADGTIDPSLLGGGIVAQSEMEHEAGDNSRSPSPFASSPGRKLLSVSPQKKQMRTGMGKVKGKGKAVQKVVLRIPTEHTSSSDDDEDMDLEKDEGPDVPKERPQPRPKPRIKLKPRTHAMVGTVVTTEPFRRVNVFTDPIGVMGKRKRKPTARALALWSISSHSQSTSSSPEPEGMRSLIADEDKQAPVQRPTSETQSTTLHQLALALTFCHQCRRKTTLDKMHCTTIKASGDRCGMRFCVNCVVKRYPDIQFDSYASSFTCPRCTDTCNCTYCCKRRGDVYVSSGRGVRVDPETLELVRVGPPCGSKGKGKAKDALPSPSPTYAYSPVPLPPNHDGDLSKGAYWGAVYSVTGERLGGAFVGEDSHAIVVKTADGAFNPLRDSSGLNALRKPIALPEIVRRPWPFHGPRPSKRVFIGTPQPSWNLPNPLTDVELDYREVRMGVRAYIGDPAALEPIVPHSYDSRESTLSPLTSSDVDEPGSSPSKAEYTQVDIGFVIAQALAAIADE